MTPLTQQIALLMNQVTTMSEMKYLNEVFRFKWKNLQAVEATKALTGIIPGATVTFKGKRGETITGKVSKINNKSVKVDTAVGTWRVSPTLLSVVP